MNQVRHRRPGRNHPPLQRIEVQTIPVPNDGLAIDNAPWRDLRCSGSGKIRKHPREVFALPGPKRHGSDVHDKDRPAC